MVPFPGSSLSTGPSPQKWSRGDFFKAAVERTGHFTAQIRVQGRNTRSCRAYFDNQSVMNYTVLEPTQDGDLVSRAGMQTGYAIPSGGVKELRFWSRTWEKEFVVDVGWGNVTEVSITQPFKGRIACEWAEYESAMIDSGPYFKNSLRFLDYNTKEDRPKIPALEEVFTFFPKWAVATKAADGLVEVWAPFVI